MQIKTGEQVFHSWNDGIDSTSKQWVSLEDLLGWLKRMESIGHDVGVIEALKLELLDTVMLSKESEDNEKSDD